MLDDFSSYDLLSIFHRLPLRYLFRRHDAAGLSFHALRIWLRFALIMPILLLRWLPMAIHADIEDIFATPTIYSFRAATSRYYAWKMNLAGLPLSMSSSQDAHDDFAFTYCAYALRIADNTFCCRDAGTRTHALMHFWLARLFRLTRYFATLLFISELRFYI